MSIRFEESIPGGLGIIGTAGPMGVGNVSAAADAGDPLTPNCFLAILPGVPALDPAFSLVALWGLKLDALAGLDTGEILLAFGLSTKFGVILSAAVGVLAAASNGCKSSST